MRPPDPLTITLGQGQFVLPAGQAACVVGPKGCGKTSLLNALAGLDGGAAARISPPPSTLRIAYVYGQALPSSAIGTADSALLAIEAAPHRSVPLVRRLAQPVPGHGHKAILPRRDALMAALRLDPDLLLIDAPPHGLDPSSARLFREVLLAHWRPLSTSVVMVAADLEEALLIADRILVMAAPMAIALDLPVIVPQPRQPEMASIAGLHHSLIAEHPALFAEPDA